MKKLLVFLLGMLTATSLLAGNEGGGGIGVKCGEEVMTLDLYEAVNVYGLELRKNSLSFHDSVREFAYESALYQTEHELDEKWAEKYKDIIYKVASEAVISKMSFRDGLEGYKFTNDATLPKLKKGCEFVQIAIYIDDQDIIVVDNNHWQKLSVLDKTALVLHEWFYKTERDAGGGYNSDSVRPAISHLFSKVEVEDMWGPLRNKEKLECGETVKLEKNYDGASVFRVKDPYQVIVVSETKDGMSGIGLYFFQLNHVHTFESYYAFLPGMTQRSLLDPKNNLIEVEVKGVLSGLSEVLTIEAEYQQRPNWTDRLYYGLKIKQKNSDQESKWHECQFRP